MNLFNGRLVKPLTMWCCERGQRDGVEVCVECRQSLKDWASIRRGECQLAKDYGFDPQEHQCSGECPDKGCPHYGTPHSHPDDPKPSFAASVFTEAQLDKLATANALDEFLGIERYRK